MQERAADVLSSCRQLNRERPSSGDVDKGILMLDEVIQHREAGWNPRQSKAVLECSKVLTKCAMLLEVRGPRMAEIARWGLKRNLQQTKQVYYGYQ